MTSIAFVSGGKDSTACLHMVRSEPELVAVFADAGATLPHVRQYIEDMCERFGVPLHVVSPSIPVTEWQERNGYPADVLPVDSHPGMADVSKARFGSPLVSYMECCSANIWEPMKAAVKDLGADHVIRGSKACDERVGVPDGHVEDGITYRQPLWHWTDQDMFDYLDEHGIPLLDHYQSESADSFDCWCCTAYMNKTGKVRAQYLATNYPDLWKQADERASCVRGAMLNALRYFEALFDPGVA